MTLMTTPGSGSAVLTPDMVRGFTNAAFDSTVRGHAGINRGSNVEPQHTLSYCGRRPVHGLDGRIAVAVSEPDLEELAVAPDKLAGSAVVE